MNEIAPLEAVRLIMQWARENHITPLNTFITVCSVIGIFGLGRFARSARSIVTDVHRVYAQALEDERRTAERLREQNELLERHRRALSAELESERALKEDLLRTLARARATAAKKGTGHDA